MARKKEGARRPRTGEERFAAYLDAIAAVLGHASRASAARAYCTGLLPPGERKSVEPMAARIEPGRVQARHQSLHHVVAKAGWDDAALLQAVREQALPAIERHGPVRHWMVDDTAFPKQGEHSVGVARQYCGQLGKQENCQVAVSLSVANGQASLPIAWRLYLPEGWAADPPRRAKAGVPEEIGFETKTAIALAQLRRAREEGVPVGIVLSDAAYGDESDFRVGVAALDLRHVLGARGATTVWPPGQAPLPPAPWSGRGRPTGTAAAQPRAPATRGQGLGHGLAGARLAHGDVARGQRCGAQLPLRRPAGAPGTPRHLAFGALAGGVAAGRVAGGRRGAEQVLALQPAAAHRAEGPGPRGQGPLADRAGLPGAEAGDRPRPPRGPRLARLPPPCQPLHRGLRLPGGRALPFPPSGPLHPAAAHGTCATRGLPAARCRSGLSGTCRTRSPASAVVSPSASSTSCHAAPAACKSSMHPSGT